MWQSILAGPDRLALEDGRQLRLLSAMEVLEARREALWLAQGEREKALCSNACLLARAVIRDEQPVYRDGSDVLAQMTPEEIGTLAGSWAQFNTRFNPGPDSDSTQVDALKKFGARPGGAAVLARAAILFSPAHGGSCPSDEGAGFFVVRIEFDTG